MFIITWEARVTKFRHSQPSYYRNGNQKLAILQCIGVERSQNMLRVIKMFYYFFLNKRLFKSKMDA